jgi:hypothetical protein
MAMSMQAKTTAVWRIVAVTIPIACGHDSMVLAFTHSSNSKEESAVLEQK